MMSEVDALKQILDYVAEKKLKEALEAGIPHMVVEANEIEIFDISQRINVGPKPV